MHTTLLADGWNGGPGPWILLVPLVWIAAVVFVRKVVFGGGRASARRGGPPWAAAFANRAGAESAMGPMPGPQSPAPSPIDTLNRRYAEGKIDEFEYSERYEMLSALTRGDRTAPPSATD